MKNILIKLIAYIACHLICLGQVDAQGIEGYYRHPDIHQNTIVFVAEGDIWKVSANGGLAHRLTTHTEEEQFPSLSPDGKTIAYSATYEGPKEVYTMPLEGGETSRRTYLGNASTVGWTPDGKLIFSTAAFNKFPENQLVTLDLKSKTKLIVPLHRAYDGVQNKDRIWFFVHMRDQNENIKRYQGGQARQIWKFDGKSEAVKLTTDHSGESFNPMWYDGRLYFITDRDGIQNIWSMDTAGKDLQQHTTHTEYDVRSANLHEGKIVYQHAADIWLLDIESGDYNKIEIRLASDMAHLREQWIEDPVSYITSVNPDPSGEKVAVTARGRVFIVPTQSGRTISYTEHGDVVRYRDAVFSHDGKNIISLSDESGELEFVQFPVDEVGEIKPLTKDGEMLRYQGIPSSDGKWIAFDDIENNLYILNVSTGKSKKISTNNERIRDFSWSPDNQWLAFVQMASNRLYQIKIYNLKDGSIFNLTSDRANNYNAKWSPDGKFIYFLSDRGLFTLAGSSRDPRLGGVYYDKTESVYHVPLKKSYRSPFREKDELMDEQEEAKEDADELVVSIDKADILLRNKRVPIPAGNYSKLEVTDKAIYLQSEETGSDDNSHLKVMRITNEDPSLKNMTSGISGFQLTQDGEKLLVHKGKSYFLVDAGMGSVSLDDGKIDLSSCKFSLDPREDWKQLYKDAWRMERDYFYDPDMHGVDWDAMYAKYLPLVNRVTTRNELNDVLERLVGELSVLHAWAGGGDLPKDEKYIGVASLGANTSRDEAEGGYRIDYIFRGNPDYSDYGEWKSPLNDPYLDINEGDIITKVNDRSTLTAASLGELLRNQAGKQVKLTIKKDNRTKEVIVKPIGGSYWLRTMDWEYSNRLKVERESDDQIGYLHINHMGTWDIGHFYREFFPVYNKQGLIIDLRNNGGGNTAILMLEKLLRQTWGYYKDRTGKPYRGMRRSFNGHMVVLVNESCGSNGETFAEAFRRFGLGITIGKRSWGGQVWLNSRNKLSDKGVMSAPMHGFYGSEGEWIIEGHGHVPDIQVDNLPHETYNGKDAQLEAAINYLQQKIAEDPRDIPPVPDYPDKSFKNNSKN
ncbi:MAG: protease [Bacteroidetes bacterium]|jgi:tricorn protease|nr:protease [Bacteroidota bacterium]